MTSAPTLLPCPFCGATPHRGLTGLRRCQMHGDPIQHYAIWCPHDCARIERQNRQLATEVWNTRAALPASSGDEDRELREIADKLTEISWAADIGNHSRRTSLREQAEKLRALLALSKRTEGERSNPKDPLKLRAAICKAVWPIARKYSIPMVADDIADAVRDAVLPLLFKPTEQSSSPADVVRPKQANGTHSLDTCPGYSPDYEAMGDCRHCGHVQATHERTDWPSINVLRDRP